MIVYLAKIVNFLASILQNFIIVASSIGQVIVELTSTIFNFIYNILKSVFIFLQIVYEDNITIFTDDLPDLASNLNEVVYYQWFYIYNFLSTLFNEVSFKVNLVINNLKWLLGSTTCIIGEVLSILKKIVIFFGDTLWLVLTFVPIHLPYLIKVFLSYIKKIIIDSAINAYMSLLRVTNFLSDVPLESFMGIITAIVIIRSCIHFRETIQLQIINAYWTLIRKVTYAYYVIYNYCTNSEVRRIARIVDGEPVALRNPDVHLRTDNDEDQGNATDALCVICQERQKCVLTLPCRHVCLCTECCMRLYGYQRTCPICRTFIYHSVTVYL